MLALFIMIFKMQGLGEKGKVYDDTQRKTKVKFDDVAGLDEEKTEVAEIVDFPTPPLPEATIVILLITTPHSITSVICESSMTMSSSVVKPKYSSNIAFATGAAVYP